MTQEFPKIGANQVALSKADINTGIILDVDNNIAIAKSQRVYLVLDSFEEALKIAEEIVTKRNDIECYIHNYKSDLLHYINCKNIFDSRS